jgi:hypothetical protein
MEKSIDSKMLSQEMGADFKNCGLKPFYIVYAVGGAL